MSGDRKGVKIYGVFLAKGGWAMTRNKRQAISEAREHQGFVRVLTDDPDSRAAFDRPTFMLLSERVPNGDFRGQKSKKTLRIRKSSTKISQRSLDRM